MDMNLPPEADVFRQRITTFLDENLPADFPGIGAYGGEAKDNFLKEWRAKLSSNKLLALSWPTEYGGAGLSALETVVLHQEFAKRGAPAGGSNDAFGINMVGNTILAVGTDEQKSYFLPRILSGEDIWCQGYSEPNAGSDLAGLGCKAELDGDEWVINGQKIWTSSGHKADWIFVLARTAPDVAKHKGISFLLVPMKQPGVEVRFIRNIAGHDHFNEVFFSDARCPKENVVGEVNGGWMVANVLLGHERGSGATVTPIGFRAELDRLVEICKERGLTDQPLVRQGLADFHTQVELLRYAGMRALSRYLAGQAPGPEASLFKLAWSEYHRRVSEAAINWLGADAIAGFGDSTADGLGSSGIGVPNDVGAWLYAFYIARSGTIYAGTSQVQRNIIGERVLGLPREPRADAGPWNEIPR